MSICASDKKDLACTANMPPYGCQRYYTLLLVFLFNIYNIYLTMNYHFSVIAECHELEESTFYLVPIKLGFAKDMAWDMQIVKSQSCANIYIDYYSLFPEMVML